MPVDLSMVGLRGLEQARQTLNDQATRGLVEQQAREQKIENDLAEKENEIQQQALDYLNGIATGRVKPSDSDMLGDPDFDSQATPLERIGRRMIDMGAVNRGAEYLKAGIDIRKKEDEMLTAKETREKTRLDNIISTASIVSKTIGVARNESEWRYGLAQLKKMPDVVKILGEDQFAALEGMEYDADVVKYFNDQAMTAKERADLDLRAMGEQRQQRAAIELAEYRSSLLDINNANLDERRRENDLKRKEGGAKADTGPTEAQVKSAKAAVANVVFQGKVPPKESQEYVAFEAGAQSIAARAQAMVRENKGLTWNEAVQRATTESQAAGDWSTLKVLMDHKFLGVRYRQTTEERGRQFKDRGSNPLDAIPMPASKNQLKTGAYYITSRGIAKWNGSAFEKAPNDD
jgi:hypothetical protein